MTTIKVKLPALGERKGYLKKQGAGISKSWKKRYVILKAQHLSYFKTPSDKEPRGVISLTASATVLAAKSDFQFTLTAKPGARTYVFDAETAEERREWIEALSAEITHIGPLSGSMTVKVNLIWTVEKTIDFIVKKINVQRSEAGKALEAENCQLVLHQLSSSDGKPAVDKVAQAHDDWERDIHGDIILPGDAQLADIPDLEERTVGLVYKDYSKLREGSVLVMPSKSPAPSPAHPPTRLVERGSLSRKSSARSSVEPDSALNSQALSLSQITLRLSKIPPEDAADARVLLEKLGLEAFANSIVQDQGYRRVDKLQRLINYQALWEQVVEKAGMTAHEENALFAALEILSGTAGGHVSGTHTVSSTHPADTDKRHSRAVTSLSSMVTVVKPGSTDPTRPARGPRSRTGSLTLGSVIPEGEAEDSGFDVVDETDNTELGGLKGQIEGSRVNFQKETDFANLSKFLGKLHLTQALTSLADVGITTIEDLYKLLLKDPPPQPQAPHHNQQASSQSQPLGSPAVSVDLKTTALLVQSPSTSTSTADSKRQSDLSSLTVESPLSGQKVATPSSSSKSSPSKLKKLGSIMSGWAKRTPRSSNNSGMSVDEPSVSLANPNGNENPLEHPLSSEVVQEEQADKDKDTDKDKERRGSDVEPLALEVQNATRKGSVSSNGGGPPGPFAGRKGSDNAISQAQSRRGSNSVNANGVNSSRRNSTSLNHHGTGVYENSDWNRVLAAEPVSLNLRLICRLRAGLAGLVSALEGNLSHLFTKLSIPKQFSQHRFMVAMVCCLLKEASTVTPEKLIERGIAEDEATELAGRLLSFEEESEFNDLMPVLERLGLTQLHPALVAQGFGNLELLCGLARGDAVTDAKQGSAGAQDAAKAEEREAAWAKFISDANIEPKYAVRLRDGLRLLLKTVRKNVATLFAQQDLPRRLRDDNTIRIAAECVLANCVLKPSELEKRGLESVAAREVSGFLGAQEGYWNLEDDDFTDLGKLLFHLRLAPNPAIAAVAVPGSTAQTELAGDSFLKPRLFDAGIDSVESLVVAAVAGQSAEWGDIVKRAQLSVRQARALKGGSIKLVESLESSIGELLGERGVPKDSPLLTKPSKFIIARCFLRNIQPNFDALTSRGMKEDLASQAAAALGPKSATAVYVPASSPSETNTSSPAAAAAATATATDSNNTHNSSAGNSGSPAKVSTSSSSSSSAVKSMEKPVKPVEEENLDALFPKHVPAGGKWPCDWFYRSGDGLLAGWQRRLVVLREEKKELHIYKEGDITGSNISALSLAWLSDGRGTYERFSLKDATCYADHSWLHGRAKHAYPLVVKNPSKTMILEAPTEHRREEWLLLLNATGCVLSEAAKWTPLFSGADIEGYLSFLDGSSWTPRYCVIHANTDTLVFYKDAKAATPGGKQGKGMSIALDKSTVVQDKTEPVNGHHHCLVLSTELGHGKRYSFCAATKEEKEQWLARMTTKCAIRPSDW